MLLLFRQNTDKEQQFRKNVYTMCAVLLALAKRSFYWAANAIVVSAVLRVVGGNGNLMVQLDFIILNSRPRMHVQNQRT